MASVPSEEVVVPFPAPRNLLPRVSAVRGILIVTSLRALRTRNLYDAYLTHVDPKARDAILAITAASWNPSALALEHYRACDRLNLTSAVIEDIGLESGRIINESVLGVVARLSRESGMTPWMALAHSNRLVWRTYQGGGVCVTKLGPKDARFEWVGQPSAASFYFRTAFGAFIRGVLSMFATPVVVREIPRQCDALSVAYRCSWV